MGDPVQTAKVKSISLQSEAFFMPKSFKIPVKSSVLSVLVENCVWSTNTK